MACLPSKTSENKLALQWLQLSHVWDKVTRKVEGYFMFVKFFASKIQKKMRMCGIDIKLILIYKLFWLFYLLILGMNGEGYEPSAN